MRQIRVFKHTSLGYLETCVNAFGTTNKILQVSSYKDGEIHVCVVLYEVEE